MQSLFFLNKGKKGNYNDQKFTHKSRDEREGQAKLKQALLSHFRENYIQIKT